LIRLWVKDDLAAGARVALEQGQAHYLRNVMRLAAGEALLVFNGREGEWRARLTADGKRDAALHVEDLVRPQTAVPDVALLIALVKRARLETIVEKATELGVRQIELLTTERTNADHTNLGRLQAIAVEAAEQTGRLDAPSVLGPEKLSRRLAAWPAETRLMFCDEAGDAPQALAALSAPAGGPWAILIGPEGGFSPDERAAIRALPAAVPVSLGPRILRADTAAISELTLWQAALGDFGGA